MGMVSKGPDELSENDLLSEVELSGSDCTGLYHTVSIDNLFMSVFHSVGQSRYM